MLSRHFRTKIFHKIAHQDENQVRDIYDLPAGYTIEVIPLSQLITQFSQFTSIINKENHPVFKYIVNFIIKSFNQMVGRFVSLNINYDSWIADKANLNSTNPQEIFDHIRLIIHDLMHEVLRADSIKNFKKKEQEQGEDTAIYSLEEYLEEDIAISMTEDPSTGARMIFGLRTALGNIFNKHGNSLVKFIQDKLNSRTNDSTIVFSVIMTDIIKYIKNFIFTELEIELNNINSKSRVDFIKKHFNKVLNKANQQIMNLNFIKQIQTAAKINNNSELALKITNTFINHLLEISAHNLRSNFYFPEMGMAKNLGFNETHISLIRRWMKYLMLFFGRPAEKVFKELIEKNK